VLREPTKAVTVRPPTLERPHGKAWQLDIESPRAHAGIDAWLVEAAWAHPLWHSYLVLVMHLRPVPELPEPIIHLRDATHELHVDALDPRGDRDRLVTDGPGPWCLGLHPGNFAAQFIEVTDELARERVRKTVEMMCNGWLSPDTDFLRQWIALYGDNMIKQQYRRE
jgi:hypothetical protein